MWRTPSRERVCEVQPIENNGSTSGSAQRYTSQYGRRYSDFTLATIPSDRSTRRRASEMPPRIPLGPPPPIPPRSKDKVGASGIVCSNTDLISILNTLTSSATEIDRCGLEEDGNGKSQTATTSTSTAKSIEQKRNRLILLLLMLFFPSFSKKYFYVFFPGFTFQRFFFFRFSTG